MDDKISLPEGQLTLDLTKDYTMTSWIKTNTIAHRQLIFSSKSTGNTAGVFHQVTALFGKIQFTVYNGTDFVLISSPETLSLDIWTFATFIRNGTSMSSCFNGNCTSSTMTLSGLGTPTTALQIGNRLSSISGFNGSIDEVMIFNTALNSSQILDIYNNQSRRFKSFGTQTLSPTNVSTGNYYLDLNSVFNNYLSSNISGNISEAAHQNLTGLNRYNITTTTNNVTFNFNFVPDTYGFYTPNLISLSYDLICGTKISNYFFIPRGCIYHIAKGTTLWI